MTRLQRMNLQKRTPKARILVARNCINLMAGFGRYTFKGATPTLPAGREIKGPLTCRGARLMVMKMLEVS